MAYGKRVRTSHIGGLWPLGDGMHAEVSAVVGLSAVPASTLTRPADTTAYAAGDVVATSTTAPTPVAIEGAAWVDGGGGVILSAHLIDSANQAAPGEFEAWVFSTAPALDNDNAPFTPTDAELAHLVAVIPFHSALSHVGDATVGAGGNRVYMSEPVCRQFICASDSRDLYWVLVARSAYTPVSSEQFTLRLSVGQD